MCSSLFSRSREDHDAIPPTSLLPFRILCEEIILRFKYHFDKNQATNRLEKPEWVFAHVLAQIRDHGVFLQEIIQPILDQCIPQNAAYKPIAIHEFILVLLKPLRRKIASNARAIFHLSTPPPTEDKPKSAPTPPASLDTGTILLSGLVRESVSFDQSLEQLYGFEARDFAKRWFADELSAGKSPDHSHDSVVPASSKNKNSMLENRVHLSMDGPGLSVFTDREDWINKWLTAEKASMSDFELCSLLIRSVA